MKMLYVACTYAYSRESDDPTSPEYYNDPYKFYYSEVTSVGYNYHNLVSYFNCYKYIKRPRTNKRAYLITAMPCEKQKAANDIVKQWNTDFRKNYRYFFQ